MSGAPVSQHVSRRRRDLTGNPPVFNLLRHGQEGLLNVRRVLGTSLEERNTERVREFLKGARATSANLCLRLLRMCQKKRSHLRGVVVHDLLIRQIALVADQELVDTLVGITVNFLEPLLDVVESIHVGNIVDNDNTVRSTVVRRGDGTETFLARGIPLYQRPQQSERSKTATKIMFETHDLQFHGLSFEFDSPDFLEVPNDEK